nr:hypothetical protein [Xanthomonas translucens]
MQTLIEASGVRCTDTKAARGCTAGNPDAGDIYDVALSPDCGDDGFFASVAQDTRPACPPSRTGDAACLVHQIGFTHLFSMLDKVMRPLKVAVQLGQEDQLVFTRAFLVALVLGAALVACKPQQAEHAATAPVPATAAPTGPSAANCPNADFDSFLKRFSADIAVQEKATADPLTMIRLDPDAQPEPKPVTSTVALHDVEWPVIPNLDAARNGGREVTISEEAGGRRVLVRTADTSDQQVYHFAQRPCWTLVKVDDQSL